jgi:hypothetical protein
VSAAELRWAQEREHYGFDLSWIRTIGRWLTCLLCGERLLVPGTADWETKSALCGGFIHDHAVCGRTAAKPGRL